MQLGTRWSVGAEAPRELPAVVIAAVREVEAEIAADPRLVGRDTAQWRWTLTWLEGNPVVELDEGTVIRYDSSTDAATTTSLDEHE